MDAASIVEAKPEEATGRTAQGTGEQPETPPDLAALWTRVIRSPGLHPVLRAILTNSSLASLVGGKATIVCGPRFAAGAPKWAGNIAELLAKEAGAPVEVIVRGAAASEPSATGEVEPRSVGAVDPAPQATSPAPRVNIVQATEHPLVKQALELFGGRVVDVQPRKK